MLAIAPGAKLSATIAAFSAALQRRRRGTPVRTSTRRKLCPSIGKLLGKPASLPRLNEAGSSVRPHFPQYASSVSLTMGLQPIPDDQQPRPEAAAKVAQCIDHNGAGDRAPDVPSGQSAIRCDADNARHFSALADTP